MSLYAAGTTVPAEKSKAEIEGTLRRYGASEFASGWDQDKAIIGFKCQDRFVRFILPLPDRSEKRFQKTPAGRNFLTPEGREKAWEQACRQRWRALALCIKAKLEAVASGITTFEDEFLAHIVLPDGTTIGKWMQPQIEQAYKTQQMPRSLLALPPGAE